mgnify:CR=1 FL=1
MFFENMITFSLHSFSINMVAAKKKTHSFLKPVLIIPEFFEVLASYVFVAFVSFFEFAFDMDYKKK